MTNRKSDCRPLLVYFLGSTAITILIGIIVGIISGINGTSLPNNTNLEAISLVATNAIIAIILLFMYHKEIISDLIRRLDDNSSFF